MNRTRLTCRWIARLGAVAIAVAAVVGCGPSTDRLRIRGEVRLDGSPIDGGSIRFTQVGQTKPQAAGATIRQGAFDIPREKGLPPGEYRLSISAPDYDGPKVPYRPAPGRPPIMVTRERIPASFNLESEQVVELEANGKNYFVFEIPSGD